MDSISTNALDVSAEDVGRPTGSHCLYVIRLCQKVLSRKKFLRANPEWSGSGLCLYVGMTGLTPEERFENHKSGYKASRWPQKYGVELLPRFYKPLNRMSWETAGELEEVLADHLRSKGHAVWQK